MLSPATTRLSLVVRLRALLLCRCIASNTRLPLSLKSVLASTLNVQDFCPGTQNHVGRVEETRKRAFSTQNTCVTPNPSTKLL